MPAAFGTLSLGTFSGVASVVFDFDGVIIESTEIKTRAFLELFGDYPEHLEAIRHHHLEHLGQSRFEKFAWIYRELLGRPLSSGESERLGAEYSALVLDAALACPMTAGAREALEAMRGKMPAFVASATPQQELEQILTGRNLATYFERVWGAPTPKTEAIQQVLADLGLVASELLMVGDGITDYRAAEATGVRFIARSSPGSQQDWSSYPVACLPDLSTLPALLGL